ncbi:alpha/beta fold hydrolase [Psychrobacter pocilloporae]|uniref:Alpha/beta hydrolase n=1 Tax=Psychrobacter pocilloporae TaxID=1775882 RepID=A0ABT6IVJ5_9GAMM|nr:alpha/beta hydrolase [Psychrobacter pocilloporae]MDH4905851.1 alpha/beta hydrolase [Psychrobacter pocilloporae]MED6318225.1 alpha/beta hydrolase [Pseudomonadota bacterium]
MIKKLLTLPIPDQYQVQTTHITMTDGTRLPISVIGQGAPVLMLHAYGMDAREFLPFILPLIGKYEFYLPHFRGFGAAKNIEVTPFDFVNQYAEDIDAIIDHVCINRNVESLPVAGISMGALVMWSYFTHFGTSRISRYLNIDQSPVIHNQPDWQGGLFGDRQKEMFAVFQEIVDRTLPYAQVEDFTHLPFSLKRRVTDVERLFSLLSVSRPRSKAVVQALTHQNDHKLAFYNHQTWQHKMRCLQAYLAIPYDFRAVIENVTIPVVNLIGGRSQLYDAKWQQKITRMLPNARDVILPRSGHAVPIDQPLQFYKLLKEFLQY